MISWVEYDAFLWYVFCCNVRHKEWWAVGTYYSLGRGNILPESFPAASCDTAFVQQRFTAVLDVEMLC